MKIIKRIKLNNGFTMQDLAIAIIILILFAGTIGSIAVSAYKVQTETKIDAVATLYAVQVAEYIDKISYEEVVEGIESTVAQEFDIPSSFNLDLTISNYTPETGSEDIIKEVVINLKYNFNNSEKNITLERLKIKEL